MSYLKKLYLPLRQECGGPFSPETKKEERRGEEAKNKKLSFLT